MPEKLFGFKLTDTSALLLFITFTMVLLLGLYELYMAINIYNNTGVFPPLYFLLAMILISISFYILYKTLQHRKRTR